MSFFSYAWDWVTTSANWRGSGGIPHQILAHLGYSGLPLLVAALIAVPLGVVIGHTGRGAVFVVNVANAWRAIPTLGLLVLIAVYQWPTLARLTLDTTPTRSPAMMTGVASGSSTVTRRRSGP